MLESEIPMSAETDTQNLHQSPSLTREKLCIFPVTAWTVLAVATKGDSVDLANLSADSQIVALWRTGDSGIERWEIMDDGKGSRIESVHEVSSVGEMGGRLTQRRVYKREPAPDRPEKFTYATFKVLQDGTLGEGGYSSSNSQFSAHLQEVRKKQEYDKEIKEREVEEARIEDGKRLERIRRLPR